MKKTLTIVSRKSPLAMWQANFVKQQLQILFPELNIVIIGVVSQGDKILDVPLAKLGGKGLFVKTLEEHLLDQRADIAVHSLKDMPTEQPEGLFLQTILARDDPRDAVVSPLYSTLQALPPKACFGTSSLRRQAQILAFRKDLQPKMLRGNVNSRLQKLQSKAFDAIILAASGLKRLGLTEVITEYLPIEQVLPAIGQGALCIECRTDDLETQALVQPLSHQPTTNCVLAERALLRALAGNCQSPIAGFATLEGSQITLQGRVAKPDGSLVLTVKKSAPFSQAENLGKQVAEALFDQGAQAIMTACEHA